MAVPVAAAVAALALFAGCSDGSDGARGASGPVGPPGPPAPAPAPDPTDPNLGVDDPLPGAVLTVLSLSGASGANGAFQVGDSLAVTFTLTKGDGSRLGLAEMDSGSIYVSGPTTRYQRVLPRATDLRAAAVANADGSYTYTFADPIPAVYAAPYNDTASFGAGDGELTGQPLESGTYTLGIEAYKNYFVDGASFRDPVNVTRDFPFGTATVIQPREVVTQANCNNCHTEVRAHGTFRRDVKLCVLCHTVGAEDRNNPSQAGGTPGVSIDFRVMIHRIHNGKHLPSVLGVGTNADGSRNYGLSPKPYQVAGFSTADFSEVAFPVWPNLNIGMPRDAGYSGLDSSRKTQEDEMLRGVTSCDSCHGDPDGSGPLPAPAQGNLAHANPTRAACGSCHDDVDWSRPYTANGVTMPAVTSDAGCATCHPASGGSLASRDGHRHPLRDPALFPGYNLSITSLSEAGTNNGNGKLDPGEAIGIAFTMKDDLGNDIAPGGVASLSVVVAGPTTNHNVLLNGSIPVAGIGAGPTYSVTVPEVVLLEKVGDSTAAGGEAFTTAIAPHWTTGANTTVQVRTGTSGGSSTLTAAVPARRNFVDLADATGFARNDYIVIDDGGAGEEYLRIQTVENNRLWFGSAASTSYHPGTRVAHAVNATVREVQLATRTSGTHYTLDATTGTLTEGGTDLGTGAVLVSYTTDFVLPATYPNSINDTPALDETWGEWTGKALAPGTYTLTLWGRADFSVSAGGEVTGYRGISVGGKKDFLVGSASTLVPYAAISSGNNCLACHQDLYFHGGSRRGFDTCIACHGTSGAEDRPQFVAPGAPATDDVSVAYRTMLHKIHMGAELTNADTYAVVGFGSGAYPNNFGTSTYEHVEFPDFTGGVKNCAKCHGQGTANWQDPPSRDHPTEQGKPVRAWRATCGACHDSSAAQAHIDVNTGPTTGAESCAVCHGPGKEQNVERMHRTR